MDETIALPPDTATKTTHAEGEIEWGVSRIKAPQVWQAFGIDGTGIVVASLDSGVDYFHPDLQTRYRGYRGANVPALHQGNWYDAIGDGALYPVDSNKHGTHTMGTLVGEDGIGVAPGATWIAVRAFDSSGTALESWLHDAFQWLLAPASDPALAPHIVNNSWGNDIGSITIFEEDVQHLLAAGIMPVFAAGNAGPNPSTVGSPGSFDISLAVGATDSDDEIANFSSRGPSPWSKIKPEVSAPGVTILSTLPGGSYGTLSGTSMAAPHVAGTVALMLQANSVLTSQEIIEILTKTATSLVETTPNNDYGWGLVDAYAAIALILNAGTINGTVTDQESGRPIEGANLTFTQHGSGQTSATTTQAGGAYEWVGMNGSYQVSVSAFGYTTQLQAGLDIVTGTTLTQNFALVPVLTGVLKGTITDQQTGLPISATITIEGTPVVAHSQMSDGAYTISLPQGVYTMTIVSPGYRIAVVSNLNITIGQNTLQAVALVPAPTILLVDGEVWDNVSQISYYQQSLDDLRYHYETYRLKHIPDDVPISSTLTAYDIVIWSSPNLSPGFSEADEAFADFLDQGGQLLLSGQDVAFFDGGGFPTFTSYYRDYLKSSFSQDHAHTTIVEPVPGDIFSGLDITIAGGDGADNQFTPDVIEISEPDFATQVLTYSTGGSAGHRIGQCLPYRALVFPFGFEAVSHQATRTQLLERSLDWFQSGPVTSGFEILSPNPVQSRDFGEVATHTIRLRNLAEIGGSDSYTLSLSHHQWPTHFPYTSITLAPCQSAWLTFTVEVPPDVPWDAQDILTITARSTQSPGVEEMTTRITKAPAPILLVDDDRWFNFEEKFEQALVDNGFQFDYWDVGTNIPGDSPPLTVLQRYPIVIWFNGYDWFDPLRTAEEDTLQAYLEGGGRLILTSQEYLYKLPDHEPSDFATTYLGVETHSEILSSTIATGNLNNPMGYYLGPYPLTFPFGYKNWTDSLTPTTSASVAFVSQDGFANALTNIGGAEEIWHTAFFGFGLELLAEADLAELMQRLVGWLSWLGTSTVVADLDMAADNDHIHYTAVLRNDGPVNINTAIFTATFPSPLTLVSGSETGGVSETTTGELVWRGPLSKNQVITFTYQALVDDDTPYGTLSRQINWLGYEDHALFFNQAALVPVNVAAWPTTYLEATPTWVGIGEVVTYTLHLTNSGVAAAPLVTITTEIPPYLQVLTETIAPDQGSLNLSQLDQRKITWFVSGPLHQGVQVTYAAKLIAIPYPFSLSTTFVANDGFKGLYNTNNHWTTTINVIPYATHLPLIFKE